MVGAKKTHGCLCVRFQTVNAQYESALHRSTTVGQIFLLTEGTITRSPKCPFLPFKRPQLWAVDLSYYANGSKNVWLSSEFKTYVCEFLY